jgi:hypothetical protein
VIDDELEFLNIEEVVTIAVEHGLVALNTALLVFVALG